MFKLTANWSDSKSRHGLEREVRGFPSMQLQADGKQRRKGITGSRESEHSDEDGKN